MLTTRFRPPAHHFKRWTFIPGYFNAPDHDVFEELAGKLYITSQAVIDGWISFNFKLTDLPNYTEFTNLYDQYRINKVVLKLFPSQNVNQFHAYADPLFPVNYLTLPVMSVIDYNDGQPLAEQDLQQYTHCKYHKFPNAVSITLTPACQGIVSRDDTTSNIISGQPLFKKWLSCDQATIEHFGVKMFIPNVGAGGSSTNNTVRFSVKACYYISCKNVR